MNRRSYFCLARTNFVYILSLLQCLHEIRLNLMKSLGSGHLHTVGNFTWKIFINNYMCILQPLRRSQKFEMGDNLSRNSLVGDKFCSHWVNCPCLIVFFLPWLIKPKNNRNSFFENFCLEIEHSNYWCSAKFFFYFLLSKKGKIQSQNKININSFASISIRS